MGSDSIDHEFIDQEFGFKSLSQEGFTAGVEISNVLLRCEAPLFNAMRDGGTPNSLASCRMTSLFALPSAGGAVVLIRSRPFFTPWISLRLPRGCTRTGTIRLISRSVPAGIRNASCEIRLEWVGTIAEQFPPPSKVQSQKSEKYRIHRRRERYGETGGAPAPPSYSASRSSGCSSVVPPSSI